MMTDPIADMLTRIRNGGRARMARVSMPASRLRREIARVLKEQGFIRNWEAGGEAKKPTLTVELRYTGHNRPMIEGLERVSRPGRRVYVNRRELPGVEGGVGIAILSTPQGILTHEQALSAGVGGEVLARIW